MKEITDEQAEQFFKGIINTDKFEEIDKFIGISRFLTPPSMFGKLRTYLMLNHQRSDVSEPDYEHFIDFFESYKNDNFKFISTEEGYVDLRHTLHLEQPTRYIKSKGVFTDKYLLFADGSIAITKYTLNHKFKYNKSGVVDGTCIYCPVIGTGIAKEIGVDTSENTLAFTKDGQLRILSKSFLRPGEEMITFLKERMTQKSSYILEKLDEELSLRKFSSEEISKVKLDYLKQEFMAKLIGLRDQKPDNTGLIISKDDKGRMHVRLAPMFDYDYSFYIGQNRILPVNLCDNGKADIGSLIKQYKDYPGFLDFVKNAVYSLDMNKVYKRIYSETGLEAFKTPEENKSLEKFSSFVTKNLNIAKRTLTELVPNERGEKQ